MSLIVYIQDNNIIREVDENNTKSSNLTEKKDDKIESISKFQNLLKIIVLIYLMI